MPDGTLVRVSVVDVAPATFVNVVPPSVLTVGGTSQVLVVSESPERRERERERERERPCH